MNVLTRAAVRVGIWLLPSTSAYDMMRIFMVSAAVGFFYLYFGSFSVETGVAGYGEWAEALVSGKGFIEQLDSGLVEQLKNRDVGMPLIMVIGGFPFTHSLIGVTIIQALVGMAMPLLAYSAIRPWFPVAAYYTAIASAICLAPFVLFKFIHHDQPYIFFSMLSLWLVNRYIYTARPANLYALALAVVASALIRQVGKGLFPLMLTVCFIGRKDSAKRQYIHYLASILIFVGCAVGYSIYRGKTVGHLSTNLGTQAFFNIYLNSADFGVKLSSDLGPNMKLIVERAYNGLQPSPAEAILVHRCNCGTPDFLAEHFYKYNADELLDRIFSIPNWEYLEYLFLTVDDHVFLMASIEAALAHPLYVIKFTLRNAWQLLYDPGWVHAQNTIEPLIKGEHPLFPFGGDTTAGQGNVEDRTPDPAFREVSYIPLSRQPEWLKEFYYAIEKAWVDSYHPLTEISCYLILVTWFATCIGFLYRIFRTPALARWSEVWLSERVIPASLGTTALLLANIGITAALVDALYRYDYSLLMFKVMLAGIGGAVLLHVLSELLSSSMARLGMPLRRLRRRATVAAADAGSAPKRAAELAWPERHVVASCVFLSILTIVGFWGWAHSLTSVAVAEPAEGTINVMSASFGANCGAPNDNVLQYVRSACSGKQECTYVFDWREIGDPTGTCSKEFQVEWKCSQGGPIESRVVPDPAQGASVPLTCQQNSARQLKWNGPNLARPSGAFTSNRWRPERVTVVPNAAIAPDGTKTAFRLVETTDNGLHRIETDVTGATASEVHTLSLYVKPAERGAIYFEMRDGGPGKYGVADFDLMSKTVAGQSGDVMDAGMQELPNGWYRCWAAMPYATGTVVFNFTLQGSSDDKNKYVGNSQAGLLIWGVQFEPGNQPRAYAGPKGRATP
jgi:hypothetical protein